MFWWGFEGNPLGLILGIGTNDIVPVIDLCAVLCHMGY